MRIILLYLILVSQLFCQGVTRIVYEPVSEASSWFEISGLTCIGAWTPVGAASMNASLTDESGAGALLTNNTSITLVDSGWAASGGHYLSSDIALDQINTIAVKFSNVSGPVYGAPVGGEIIAISPNAGATFDYWSKSTSNSYFYPNTTKGIVVWTDGYIWVDGSLKASPGVVGSITNSTCLRFYFNRYGSASSGYIKAIAIYSDVCDSEKAAELYNNLLEIE